VSGREADRAGEDGMPGGAFVDESGGEAPDLALDALHCVPAADPLEHERAQTGEIRLGGSSWGLAPKLVV
jgi:hypothetical protein